MTVEELRSRALRNHYLSKTHFGDEIRKMDECYNFYHGGGIFSNSEISKLKREKRPIISTNLVKPAINLILGLERDTQQMMRVYPEHGDDVILAAALDAIGNWLWHRFNGHDLRAEAFGDAVMARRGHVFLYPEIENGAIKLSALSLDPRQCFPDPESRDYDPVEDGNFFSMERWFEPETLKTMYPDEAREIGALIEALERGAEVPSHFSDQGARMPGEDYSHNPNIYFDRKRRRVGVIEQFMREASLVYRLHDPVSGHYEDFETRKEATGAHEDAIRTVPGVGRRMQILRMHTPAINRIVIIGGAIVPDGHAGRYPASEKIGMPIVTMRAHYAGGRGTGVIDDLISPTRQHAKTYSNFLHILTSVANSGWLVPNQSQIPEDYFKQHGAETGLEVRYNAPFKPEKIMPQPPAMGHLADMDVGKDLVDRVSGANDSLRGVAPKNIESGAGVERLQSYGLAVLGVLYGNLLRTERTWYEKTLMMAMEFMPLPEEVEVIGPRLTRRLQALAPEQAVSQQADQTYLRLEALDGLNRLNNLEYRVRVERGPVLKTQREYWLQKALQIASILPPGSVPPEMILNMVDHPDAQMILDNIKEQEQAQALQAGIQAGAGAAGGGE